MDKGGYVKESTPLENDCLNVMEQSKEVTPEELLMRIRTLEREFDQQSERFFRIIMTQMEREEREKEKERRNTLILCIIKSFCFLACVFVWTLGYFESSVKINRSYYEKIDKIEERMLKNYEKTMGSDQSVFVPNREQQQQ